MQAENEALQQLILEVAQDKSEARQRVGRLKDKYAGLVSKMDADQVQQQAETSKQEAQAAKDKAAQAHADAKAAQSQQEEVTNVSTLAILYRTFSRVVEAVHT